MSELSFSSDKILICDPEKSRSTCHIYISHQSLAEEKSLGKLMLLMEIRSNNSNNEEIINQILEEMKSAYFNTDDLNVETAFEKALEKTNQRIADLIGDYDTNWLDRFHAVIMVIKNNTMYCSAVGDIQIFLTRNERITNIIQSVAEGNTQPDRINPLKAFSHIVSGTLEQGDALLLCTPTLLDYLSQEKIKRTLVDYNTHQAVATLEKLLIEDSGRTAFAALLIKFEAEKIATSPTPHQQIANPDPTSSLTPQSSMADLLQQTANTTEILSPSISSYLWQSTKRSLAKIGDFIKLKILRQSPRRVRWQQEIRETTRFSPPPSATPQKIISSIPKTAGKIGSGLGTMLKSVPKIFSRQKPVASFKPSKPRSIVERVASMVATFKRLPRTSKILFLCAVIVAVVLAESIYGMASNRQTTSTTKNTESTINLINQKITEAEADLSYKNEEGAKTLLAEAQNLIASLPNHSKKDKTTISDLQNSVQAQLDKTKHEIVIASPTVLADLTTTDSAINAISLSYLNKNIYTFDPAKKNIYGIGSDGKVTTYTAGDAAMQFLIPQTTSKTLAILNTTNALLEYSFSAKKATPLTFSFGTTDINIAAVAFYESRLYFLDIRNNQILRANKGAAGYGTPVAWIKDSTDVRDAVSLTVDGSIYVLNKNGAAIKMTSGQKAAWSLSAIEPALTKANKIWTDSTKGANLYILDAAGKRIVEFSKDDGKFLNQYTSSTFTNLKDITVDVAGKIIYILNGNQIISIPFAV